MSTGAKFPWADGLQLALDLIALLAGSYRRAALAGSLRRGKAEVGDVELVLAPLFDGAANLLDQRFEQLLAEQVVEKRLNRLDRPIAWGNGKDPSRFKALLFRGVPVDLFVVQPDRQWGPTMVIRTGPGRANKALVATVGTRTDEGDPGVLPPGLKFLDGAVVRFDQLLDTPEEEDVFAACGLPYLAPPERTAERYAEAAEWRAGDERDYHVRMAGGQSVELPFYGHGTRVLPDGYWTPDGAVRFLDPAVARPTVVRLQSAPVEQQNLFA